jgi:hypothetical protein
LLAVQHSLEAFLHQLLAHPVNHGNAGVQSIWAHRGQKSRPHRSRGSSFNRSKP